MTRLCRSFAFALGLAFVPAIVHAQSLLRDPEENAADALANVPEFAELLLAQPDAVAQVGGAIAACALAVDDADAAIALLEDAGWAAQPAEEGETIFAATGDGVTFVSITDAGTDAGSYCTVTTTVMGTADAQKNFFDVTNALGWPPFDWADDGNFGCLQADLGAEIAAQITAANDECASQTDATLTFTYAEGN